MLKNKEKIGAFIVPTGVGASIGGYAGDASCWARKFSTISKLIVNPNVVNAGGFSGINQNMLYLEGSALNSFFKNEINLSTPTENKIGIIFDKEIPQEVLNVHVNTINAVKCVYGVDIIGYEITKQEVGIGFEIQENGISAGFVKNPETLENAAELLLKKGANAIAVVCFFEDPESSNQDYAHGVGTDPVGGVEAIISHYLSGKIRIPVAHSPAFEDCQISTDIVDLKSASEYITPTFLPCVLLGLQNAPQFSRQGGVNIKDLDFLIMPADCLGSTIVFEAIKNNISVYAIEENQTALDVTAKKLGIEKDVIICKTYQECFDLIKN
ncbi:MAG: DUF3326 domain-containing protein [Candidatus Gastranaerophilales bacterium]